MNVLFETLLTNGVALVVLFIMAILISRWIRRPALLHAIWLIVLLRALSPPLLEIAVLPRPPIEVQKHDESAPIPFQEPSLNGALSVIREGSATEMELFDPSGLTALVSGLTPLRIVGLIWITGSLIVFGLALVRGRRVEALLMEGPLAPTSLQSLGERVAEQMGTTCPPVRVVDDRFSPMIWFRPRRMLLALPKRLLPSLTEAELRVLLTHEFAHLKRRDHWVRMIEFAATVLFWWHPAVRWTRSRLRRAEERCCDQRVLETLPDSAAIYSSALLKTARFLAGMPRRDQGALASAFGLADLEQRIQTIMKNKRQESQMTLTTNHKRALLLAGTLAIVLFPTWSESRAHLPPQEEPSIEGSDREDALRELRKKAEQLERQMREIRARRFELETESQRVRAEIELKRLEAEAERLEDSGEKLEASWLRKRMELMSRQLQIEAEEMELERLNGIERQELKEQLEAVLMETQRAHEQNAQERIEELRDRSTELTSSLAEVSAEIVERELQIRRSMSDLEERQYRLESEQLRQSGQEEEADHLERELELMRNRHELDMRAEATEREMELLRMRAELQEAQARLEDARAIGADSRETRELEARVDVLKAQVKAFSRPRK